MMLTGVAKSLNVVSRYMFVNCIVSRIQATSSVNKLFIELDVNTEIYPIDKDSFYKLVLASSVNADGSDTFDVIRFENEGSESGMGSLID